MSTEDNAGLRERSGKVANRDRLSAFLYDLMRDHVPLGVVEKIVRDLPKPGETFEYTNGWLASYCEDVAHRIMADKP